MGEWLILAIVVLLFLVLAGVCVVVLGAISAVVRFIFSWNGEKT
jgi:hypothetical protein